jgi:hypothetical protein
MSLDLALAVFPHIEGADHAYADVLDSVGAPTRTCSGWRSDWRVGH